MNVIDTRIPKPEVPVGAARTARARNGLLTRWIPQSRLFRKYAALLAFLVTTALIAASALGMSFLWQTQKAGLGRLQKEKALGAANQISQFVKEIEGQVGWTTHAALVGGAAGAEQRRFDFIRLLRQVPAITELSYIDAAGIEQLRISRLAMDQIASKADLSAEPKFTQARAKRIWTGPVYFHKESEPYMTMAVSGTARSAGVTGAEVNLKFIWDVVTAIQIGKQGQAFVADETGRLIAHPDISLVLRKTDLSKLPLFLEARAEKPFDQSPEWKTGQDYAGREVLSAHAAIPQLGWTVFVEVPVSEALQPVYQQAQRMAWLVLAGIGLAGLSGLWFAGKMAQPIQALRAGAVQLGSGDLSQRIDVKTGDELEALAGEFNAMAGRLQESYAGLEQKVETRTKELQESLEYQAASSEVLETISRSQANLQPILDRISATAARLCRADHAVFFTLQDGRYRVGSSSDSSSTFVRLLSTQSIEPSRATCVGRTALEQTVVHIPDALADTELTSRPENMERQRASGLRTVLGVPVIQSGAVVAVIFLARLRIDPFSQREIGLVRTLADQAVIAIENARLFEAEQTRTKELTESLDQQTASADILQVISTSLTDTQPVFDAIVKSGHKLIPDCGFSIALADGDMVRIAAVAEADEALAETWRSCFPVPLTRDYFHSACILDRKVIDIPKIANATGDKQPGKNNFIGKLAGRYSACSYVPLLRGDAAIGAIAVPRLQPGPLSDKQLALLETFASQAVIAIENARLFEAEQTRTKELAESLKQQTATADVLKTISRSAFDEQTVLDELVASAAHLCEAQQVAIHVSHGDQLPGRARHGFTPQMQEALKAIPQVMGPGSLAGRTIAAMKAVHIPDVTLDAEYTSHDFATITGARTMLGLPLMRGGSPVGLLSLYRTKACPFTQRQIELMETFADQAVIAIENARLFEAEQTRTKELTESLEYQTATAEVLGVISKSPNELQPVLDAIVTTAKRLCSSERAMIWSLRGDAFDLAAHTEMDATLVAHLQANPLPTGQSSLAGRTTIERRTIHVTDMMADPVLAPMNQRTQGDVRTLLSVPLLREGRSIGVLQLARTQVQPFTQRQIDLVTTFADQAVIAINNVQNYKEIQARTAELTESLEYQTATADVLKVISRSKFDLDPVLQSVVDTAARLCRADKAGIYRLQAGAYHLAAQVGNVPEYQASERFIPIYPGTGTIVGRAALARHAVQCDDALSDPTYEDKDRARIGNVRSMLGVPLLRDGEPIGALALARGHVEPFSAREIELVSTFADQAAIAIENVRLFNEVETRTKEVTEALEYQTATSEVLGVISSSPNDLQPVLDAIVTTAARLCEADKVGLRRRIGDRFRFSAWHNYSADEVEWTKNWEPTPESVVGRMIAERRTIHSPYNFEFNTIALRQVDAKTTLGVPLMRDGETIGTLLLHRTTQRPFTDRQIKLVETFADQAVIAINNVGNFEQVQARTKEVTESLERQTATGQVLDVISRSPSELTPVLQVICDTAARMCDTQSVSIFLRVGKGFWQRVIYGLSEKYSRVDAAHEHLPGRDTLVGRVALTGKTQHIADCERDIEYGLKDATRIDGIRTMLGVPLIRFGEVVGVICLARKQVQPFEDKQIDLVTTFASQAVIAINNTRLFEEVQARTRELARSVNDLKALSDIGQIVSSTLDQKTVLSTVVERAVSLAAADAGVVFHFNEADQSFGLVETIGLDDATAEAYRVGGAMAGASGVGEAIKSRQTVQYPDLASRPSNPLRDVAVGAGFHAVLIVPLIAANRLLGTLTILRKRTGDFAPGVVAMIQSFASQSAIAIHNARLFEEIAEKGRQIEIASQHKTQFLANMSHELRTPLNAILGYAELLVDGTYGQLADKPKGILERVERNGRHLLGLINDVLDLSKIEAGEMTLAVEEYSWGSLVRNVITATEPLASVKGLKLETDIAEGLPRGAGDARRLNQVLLNLVGNAIKFTDTGHVRIVARTSEDRFRISVIDTGPGIADEDQAKVFEKFQQIDNSSTRKKGGSGLGLSISRELVELHGGTITVASNLGQGSTFTIVLPCRVEQAPEATA
jgi:GAF domain-containing protein/HAMP domain-containing protein